MNKIIRCSEDEMKKDCPYVQSKLHVNEMPKPYFEVDEKEFMFYIDTWTPLYTDYHQICRKEDYCKITGRDEKDTSSLSYVDTHIYYFSDRGYARCKVPHYDRENMKHYYENKYFRIGCTHKNVEVIDKDPFEITFKCKDCGNVWSEQTGY